MSELVSTIKTKPKKGYKKLLDNNIYIFSNERENLTLYKKSMKKAIKQIIKNNEKRTTPYTGKSISSLQDLINKIDLYDNDNGLPLKKVLNEIQKIYLDDCILFHHPKYVAHLNCPILTPTLVAEAFISSLNSSMDTWDQSTGGTYIELKLIEWTLQLLNYPKNGEGIFTSGGTQSNLMGLLLARDHYIKTRYNINPVMEGLPAEASKFKVLCSEVSHFSLKKNLSLLGLGQNAIVQVPVDKNFKMNIKELKNKMTQLKTNGDIPIAIVGTAGTTDFGSIDPLEEIAAIAKESNIWFHVDAAYGGGLLISDIHKNKLKGIELSDSATIDYHKTFYQPVSSSGFFMRDKSFVDYIKYHADYLNSKEQEDEGIPNMVKKSIQTTRRFDALKLWFTLRCIGVKGLSSYLETSIENALYTASLLKNRNDFEIIHQPEISAIVFRYTPFEDQYNSYCNLNSYIRKALFNEGKAIITSTKVNEKVFLKFTLLNPLTTTNDIDEIIDLIIYHGQQYSIKN
ncbi:aspartate aminotransferase family protein [Flavobacterium columnare]|nr:aspartate aminotransferase family protein [Flavobacterium columnare]QOG91907.1 aspartate aminotransferase family protein [Flavobacterium columnare]QOG94571.1 aspartate aminotransferase family protein [Flavobacterium columnare]QOG97230.1 aspartate aminotransferase family protein [Flavobacterium columnare]QOG99888.1 aspartate aminotransferase family protein [Flavobacterium columnare]